MREGGFYSRDWPCGRKFVLIVNTGSARSGVTSVGLTLALDLLRRRGALEVSRAGLGVAASGLRLGALGVRGARGFRGGLGGGLRLGGQRFGCGGVGRLGGRRFGCGGVGRPVGCQGIHEQVGGNAGDVQGCIEPDASLGIVEEKHGRFRLGFGGLRGIGEEQGEDDGSDGIDEEECHEPEPHVEEQGEAVGGRNGLGGDDAHG